MRHQLKVHKVVAKRMFMASDGLTEETGRSQRSTLAFLLLRQKITLTLNNDFSKMNTNDEKTEEKTFKHLETILSVNILKLDTGRSETIKRAFIGTKKSIDINWGKRERDSNR